MTPNTMLNYCKVCKENTMFTKVSATMFTEKYAWARYRCAKCEKNTIVYKFATPSK